MATVTNSVSDPQVDQATRAALHRATAPKDTKIPGNHPLWKVLSVVPVVGFIPAELASGRMHSELASCLTKGRAIECLKGLSQLNATSVVRNMLSVAALVCMVAAGVLAPVIGIVGSIIFGSVALGHASRQRKMDEAILVIAQSPQSPVVKA